MTLPILALAFLSAAAPVVAWFFILRQKDSKGMGKRYLVTFALSAIGGVMFVLFQGNIIGLLQNQIASLFFVFLLVGMVMEYFKNYVIRFSGVGAFRNIDDVIDLSFAAALGFTFGENIVEFSITFSGNNAAVQGPIQMLKYFLIREFFILPIHLFSSGLFGYFYGMGLFASKELREQNNKDFFFRIYSQFFVMLSEERRFKAVKILQGTTLSVLSYGVFFTLYQKNPMISDIWYLFGVPDIRVDEQLILLIAFVIFKVGTILFFNLMDKKRRWAARGLLLSKA